MSSFLEEAILAPRKLADLESQILLWVEVNPPSDMTEAEIIRLATICDGMRAIRESLINAEKRGGENVVALRGLDGKAQPALEGAV